MHVEPYSVVHTQQYTNRSTYAYNNISLSIKALGGLETAAAVQTAANASTSDAIAVIPKKVYMFVMVLLIIM